MESSVMASIEPISAETQSKAKGVARRLVGGLPLAETSERVDRLAAKLARLVEVDAASMRKPRRSAARG